jgi:hypothetical protein
VVAAAGEQAGAKFDHNPLVAWLARFYSCFIISAHLTPAEKICSIIATWAGRDKMSEIVEDWKGI